jgi:hypothetical protein
MSELDVIRHMMHNLPEECETTIELIENELKRLKKSSSVKERALFNQEVQGVIQFLWHLRPQRIRLYERITE